MKSMEEAKESSSAPIDAEPGVFPSCGALVGGRYQLEAPLAAGNMGTVWRAVHTVLRTPVAIKLLSPTLLGNAQMRDRFVQEARWTAAVRCANIVSVFDCGEERGIPYFVMELLAGEPLAARLARGPLSCKELGALFSDLAVALGAAHSMGIVHRDLKPDNILLVREGQREVTKLIDFGIAKLRPGGLTFTRRVETRVGDVLGTPLYMAPEQLCSNEPLGPAVDLWALAVIACECLTGQAPFSGVTIGDLAVQICSEGPARPSSLGSVPPGFDGWFARATQRDPSKRFATAQALTDSLQEVLGGASAVQSRQLVGGRSPWHRLRPVAERWLERARGVVMASRRGGPFARSAAAAALGLAVLTALNLTRAERERGSEAAAERESTRSLSPAVAASPVARPRPPAAATAFLPPGAPGLAAKEAEPSRAAAEHTEPSAAAAAAAAEEAVPEPSKPRADERESPRRSPVTRRGPAARSSSTRAERTQDPRATRAKRGPAPSARGRPARPPPASASPFAREERKQKKPPRKQTENPIQPPPQPPEPHPFEDRL